VSPKNSSRNDLGCRRATQGGTTTESYTYDLVGNRLSDLTTSAWSNNTSNELASRPGVTHTYDNNGNTTASNGLGYVYDRFGNRWQQNGPQTFIASFTGNSPGSPQNNNRMDGYSYDAAGNLLNDGTHNYAYDAENRIISVDGGSTATYSYDEDGKRAIRTNSVNLFAEPSGTQEFLYDLQGRLIHTLAPNGGTSWRPEVYAGSRHLATENGGADFIHSDWLGTERQRLVVYHDNNGAVTGAVSQTISSLPFGDGLNPTTNNWDILNFTGKERDSESTLDNFGARYYGSSLGRFMSPDPDNSGVRYANPQTWNGYAYALNNPVHNVDLDGRDVWVCIDGQDKCHHYTDDQYKRLLAEQNGKQGINLPDQALPHGDITCGGVKCGTATYFEPGMESDDAVNFGIGGVFKLAFDAGIGLFEGLFGSTTRQVAGETVAGTATRSAGEKLLASRPDWARTPGGFVNWLKNLQKAGTSLGGDEADAVISEAKKLGVDVRLDPPHPGTNWDVPHLNIGSSGQVHLEVPSGYTNPGVSTGHP